MASNHSNPHHIAKDPLNYKKSSDGGLMIIHPKDLNIVWGRDDRYWNVPENNRDMPAELYQVSWLEVTGCVNETDLYREYEVGFDVSLAPDAFGWGASPLYVMVKRGTDGESAWTKVQVNPDATQLFKISGSSKKNTGSSSTKIKTDQSSTDAKKLYFGLYEVWSEKWKGGLRIHDAYVKEI